MPPKAKPSSMFTSSTELQTFLEWAKDQKIAKIKVGDIEVEFSAFAFVDSTILEDAGTATIHADSQKLSKQEEDDLLFHSAG